MHTFFVLLVLIHLIRDNHTRSPKKCESVIKMVKVIIACWRGDPLKLSSKLATFTENLNILDK